MRSAVAGSILGLCICQGAAAAVSIDCSVPPGPRGRITCEGNYIPICEATGKRIEGRCLDRRAAIGTDSQQWLLREIAPGPLSSEEALEYKAAMDTGRLAMGQSVFTFNLDTDQDRGLRLATEPSTIRSWIAIVGILFSLASGLYAGGVVERIKIKRGKVR